MDELVLWRSTSVPENLHEIEDELSLYLALGQKRALKGPGKLLPGVRLIRRKAESGRVYLDVMIPKERHDSLCAAARMHPNKDYSAALTAWRNE